MDTYIKQIKKQISPLITKQLLSKLILNEEEYNCKEQPNEQLIINVIKEISLNYGEIQKPKQRAPSIPSRNKSLEITKTSGISITL